MSVKKLAKVGVLLIVNWDGLAIKLFLTFKEIGTSFKLEITHFTYIVPLGVRAVKNAFFAFWYHLYNKRVQNAYIHYGFKMTKFQLIIVFKLEGEQVGLVSLSTN